MAIISIESLSVDAVIGVRPWERKISQTVLIDLDMEADIRQAATSDDIADTIDYQAVADLLQGAISGSRYRLLETLVQDVAELLAKEFKPRWFKLRIAKPAAVARSRAVAVTVKWPAV